MENQTCFNLNDALTNWREELTSQPGVSPEAARELESHLVDAVADLQQRGLREEEAFWLARRRLGPAENLAAEIVKADPSRIWTERVFWMVIGLIVMRFYFAVMLIPLNVLSPFLGHSGKYLSGWNTVLMIAGYGLLGWATLAAARGRFAWMARLLASPRRLGWALGIFLIIVTASSWETMWNI